MTESREPAVEPQDATSTEGPVDDGAPRDEDVATVDRPEEEADGSSLARELAERTADLQRLQAEYVNYKRRVDRDREVIRASGADAVLRSLLTVLDDLDRADQHGELEGGFKAVADALQQAVGQHKLERFGEVGEAFDPNLHEAVVHAGESPDVTVQSIDVVFQTGYRVGERVLRAATVSVVDPASAAAGTEPDNEEE